MVKIILRRNIFKQGVLFVILALTISLSIGILFYFALFGFTKNELIDHRKVCWTARIWLLLATFPNETYFSWFWTVLSLSCLQWQLFVIANWVLRLSIISVFANLFYITVTVFCPRPRGHPLLIFPASFNLHSLQKVCCSVLCFRVFTFSHFNFCSLVPEQKNQYKRPNNTLLQLNTHEKIPRHRKYNDIQLYSLSVPAHKDTGPFSLSSSKLNSLSTFSKRETPL